MNAANTACIVGQMYLVPCLFVARSSWTGWMPPDGWVPTSARSTPTRSTWNSSSSTSNIDWRFVPDEAYEAALGLELRVPHNKVVTADSGVLNRLYGQPVMKRRKCRRVMPTFPQINSTTLPDSHKHPDSSARWARMEIAQAFTCNRLKPGNICPHRGIDLTPFAQPDGTAVCPGHGLRWDLRTGELMPRHGSKA